MLYLFGLFNYEFFAFRRITPSGAGPGVAATTFTFLTLTFRQVRIQLTLTFQQLRVLVTKAWAL
jgi:hypothetical protein